MVAPPRVGIMNLPEIPNSYLIAVLLVGMVIMRAYGIDSWTTAAISLLMGYITGKHVEQSRSTVQLLPPPVLK
jgi:hypothetical protein